MDQREAPLGPEEDSLLPEKTPVRDQRGLFDQLRNLGRGAVGKVLLATTLMGAADAAEGAERARRGSTPVVSQPEAMPASTHAEPWAMADDGTIHSVRIDNHILPYFTKAPVGARPLAGVYKDPETGKHIYVMHNRTRHDATLSAERAQPPEGTRWMAFKDKKTGKMFTRPQTEQELMLPRGPARGAGPSVQPSVSRVATPDEEAAKPETFRAPSAEVLEAEEKVKKLGYLTIEHGYDAANVNEKALREKSIVPPTGYVPLAIGINTTVNNDGSGKVLLPCPRDVMDQLHAGCQVYVYKNGKRIQVESSIVYSQQPGGKGYVNPFVEIELRGSGTAGNLSIRAEHIVLMPIYQQISNEELLQKMGPSAAVIGNAAKAGAVVPWDGSINGIDSTLFRRFGKGDCGVKAAVARDAGHGLVDAVEGYSLDPAMAKFGGKHCINIARSDGGMLTFDPASMTNLYRGPQKDFVITEVGGALMVKGWSGIKHGTNNGYYSGVRGHGSVAVSADKLGPQTAQEVIDYAEVLWQARMKTYGENLALNN